MSRQIRERLEQLEHQALSDSDHYDWFVTELRKRLLGGEERPAAAVQLGFEGGVQRGTWDEVPWGLGSDTSYRVTLESGQLVYVWLDGVTTHPHDHTSLPEEERWTDGRLVHPDDARRWREGLAPGTDQRYEDDDLCEVCGTDGGERELANALGYFKPDGTEATRICMGCASEQIVNGPYWVPPAPTEQRGGGRAA